MPELYDPKAESREFVKGVMVIGLPIMIQNLINSLVNMLDVFMVGQLGEVEITSASLGNSWFFVFTLLCGGITAAGSIFIAQHWGKNDREKIYQYMGIMFIGVMILTAILGTASICFSDRIIRLYSKDPLVIEKGGQYIKVVGFSYLFTSITGVYVAALRSTEQTRIPMISTVLSLFCNLILNYLLIFGHFGFPELGVLGAAIATLISRIIECMFIVGCTYIKKLPAAGRFRDFIHIPSQVARLYFRYGLFVILGEAIYAVGSSMYNVAYKYTGTQAQAALQIVNSCKSLSMVFTIGIGNSAGVVIGKMLGENKLDKAKRFCKKYLFFTPVFAAAVSVLLCLFSPLLLQCFQIGEQAHAYASQMIYILAFELPFRAINFTIIVGILRSGGDSFYCFMSNFCGTWLFGLPMAFLGAVVLKLPVPIVLLMVTADEIGKFFICLPRAVKYKWIKNLT